MMYTLKGSCAVMTLLLFTRTHGDLLFRHAQQQQQQRYNPAIPSLPWYLAPSQEFVLREIILESIIPSLFDTNAIHKRLLDTSFYGNSVAATYSSDNVLSRGNVYRLSNGHWMLCEDGCVDCEPCVTQGDPLFKWILQRVKRPSAFDPSRHDLQLTIISQTDDYFRTNNLWPNFYIYVTSQGERGSISVTETKHNNGSENSPPNLENNFPQQHHHAKNPFADSISEKENHILESTDKSLEQKYRNMRHRPLPVEEPAEEANQLASKLILGTDQRGQKHLVHVVPADHPPINASNRSTSSQFVEGQATRSNNIVPKQEKLTYQQISRQVFDSLNTHRQSIESFLKSPADNVSEQQIASSTDNIEVAEFSWNNRDVTHTSANFEPLRTNDTWLLSPFYVENEDGTEKYRQRKSRYGYQRIKPNLNDYHTRYANINQAGIPRGQFPMNIDFDRERRRARVRPYFINNDNISQINSSILLQSSSNGSLVEDAIPRKPGFKNGFVANSAKQIDLNETFIDKANNNSIESSSITIKRENGRLFNSERLASGEANREFETSHHAFRIITTESPIIRRGHETTTLNRTVASQINASKTFADNQQ
ncbi:uncharacterized protein LOC114934651 [Nylanderia fulva]|uniref:uncharacterized protein LOC114934651 n=1 Tax=Nylanderia fulva TaxID=613905 RepID=UPI0010FAE361|nr:uncharacterized protein LOC114934651 [Nylanderia fulva]